MEQSERRIYLINELLKENDEYDVPLPWDEKSQKRILRGLMNIRDPAPISDEFLRIQDEYLQAELLKRGITDADSLVPLRGHLCLWQGDITLLRAGAIVNAANSAMTGCYIPSHACIDNCIHTYAGVQLRLECARLMAEQGHPEPAGRAKITKAYNLPSDYVLHTVGPIVAGEVTQSDRKTLSSCYLSCLELAEKYSIRSVAFCCISTGVFHFPNEEAAKIAVATVEGYLKNVPSQIEKVIFNVFTDIDREIYAQLLS